MNSSQLAEPVVARSGASVHSREEDEFAEHEDNPLEIRSNSSVDIRSTSSFDIRSTASLDIRSTSSIQPTPSHMVAENPMEKPSLLRTQDDPDEPPPPYESLVGEGPQIAPIEYSCENSPQLLVAPHSEFPAQVEPPFRNPVRSFSQQSISPITPIDHTLVPEPLHMRHVASNGSIPRRPVGSPPGSSFSNAKAREAGFEIQPSSPTRQDSSSSFPSITMVASSEPLRHTREPGKVTAYLVPYPKPRLKGIKPEDIPERFLVYTPPNPPLSKPAPGEKESAWHKTQRTWQEDVRKAAMSKASAGTWKGFKAKTTMLINKGVALTRSSNLEFLDRVSEGAITSTAEETNEIGGTPVAELSGASRMAELPASRPNDTNTNNPPPSPNPSTSTGTGTIASLASTSTSTSTSTTPKAAPLSELTLVYPPSLALPPEKIRTEFVDSLLRTRESSRKDAIVASSLVPLAATIDAALIVTLGGLTEVSGVWAYTSIRGTLTSKKMTQGLALAEEREAQASAKELAGEEVEVKGCQCGNHEHEFGPAEVVVKEKEKEKDKCRKGSSSKSKKQAIDMRMQQSNYVEILRRYLELMCVKREFHLFPTIEETAGDVNEAAVLEAIGWQPTRRGGLDLEMEFGDKGVERLTWEQDEYWQRQEAMMDVKRLMKKGAAEWVTWCKALGKDPEGAMKK